MCPCSASALTLNSVRILDYNTFSAFLPVTCPYGLELSINFCIPEIPFSLVDLQFYFFLSSQFTELISIFWLNLKIDGFEQDKKVIIIAATNRKEDLNAALISHLAKAIIHMWCFMSYKQPFLMCFLFLSPFQSV